MFKKKDHTAAVARAYIFSNMLVAYYEIVNDWNNVLIRRPNLFKFRLNCILILLIRSNYHCYTNKSMKILNLIPGVSVL